MNRRRHVDPTGRYSAEPLKTRGSKTMHTHHVSIEDLPALLPIPKAAALLGLSRASAYRYAATGELPIKRCGGRVYVITAKIRSLLDTDQEPSE